MTKSKHIQLPLWNTEGKIPQSFAHLTKIKIAKKNKVRKITCFCGTETVSTVLPHIKQNHPDVWEDWRSAFVRLHNMGWSSRKIMDAFGVKGSPLFSWTVIENELRNMEEQGIANLIVRRKEKIKRWEPEDFNLERTTLWNFPRRGNWAVHRGDYRGNWPPQLARNLVLKYTKPYELVVDLFAGGGTTLIESWLLGRKSIGIDINPFAIKTIKARLQELEDHAVNDPNGSKLDPDKKPIIVQGNTLLFQEIMKELNVEPNSISLISAHPPYLDSIKYTSDVPGDLSRTNSFEEFKTSIRQIAESTLTWLRPGGVLCMLIGDVRKKGALIPLGFSLMQELLAVGFELQEVIIKTQNQNNLTGFWFNHTSLEYLIAHEYLLIMSKPQKVIKEPRENERK